MLADLPCPRSVLLNTADAEDASTGKPAQGARAEEEKGQRPQTIRPSARGRHHLPGPRTALNTADAEESSNSKPAQAARAEKEKGQ